MKLFMYLKLQSVDQYILENKEAFDKCGLTLIKHNDHIVLLSKDDE